MRKKQIVYKLMRRERSTGTLRSSFADGPAEVIYELRKKVEAPLWLKDRGYHLTAFKSLQDVGYSALRILDMSLNDAVVVKCRATGVHEPEVEMMDCHRLSYGDLVGVWGSWPDNTVMCRTLKPLEVLGHRATLIRILCSV